jgi:hypothetical protein
MRSVLLATLGASEGKSFAPVLSLHMLTPESRLGTFGKRGNGEYRKELAHTLAVIRRYLTANDLPQTRALLRLDGLYGTGAIIADLEGFFFVSASQRLHDIGSPDCAVAAPPASRCPLQSPGKPTGRERSTTAPTSL